MINHEEAGRPARLMRRVLRAAARWAPSRGGAVAPMFAVLAGVLILAAGVGMDVSRVTSSRNQLQDAIDAAGLALARMPADSDMDTVLNPAAQNWVRANLHGSALNPDAVTVKLTRIDGGVRISAVTDVQPTLAAVAHVGPFAVKATSTVKYQINHVEVALVLDNTFSMSVPLDGGDAKIDVLKQAANKLVDTLMTDANVAAGGVKIGVVPYAEYVNVGTINRNKPWVSVPADSQTTTAPNDQTKNCSWVTTKTQCSGGVKGTCTGVQDGVPYSYSCWTTPQTCTTSPITPYQQCGGYTPAHTYYTKWFGCVKHIVQSSKLAPPDATTPYQAIMEQGPADTTNFQSKKCLTEILPLAGTPDPVHSAINGMITSRPGYVPETYVPAGLVWGVNVLSPAAPFSEGAAYDPANKEPRKAMIVMTDGNNTRALQNTGLVAAGNAGQMNQTYSDQQRMCQYAKDNKIEVYTIGFGVTDATALTYLKSCATDSSHYFDAQSSDSLLKAFTVIAGSLSNLRISH